VTVYPQMVTVTFHMRCVWPDCPSAYPLDGGPRTPGWAVATPSAAGVVGPVLCPFHAPLGHRPTRTPEGPGVRSGCTCGWPGPLVLTVDGTRDAWRVHVVEQQKGNEE
jgi:hypothetical protein